MKKSYSIFGFFWQRFILLMRELRGGFGVSLIVLVVLAAGVFATGLLSVIGENYNRYFEKMLQKFPPNTILVKPRPVVQIGPFKLKAGRGSVLRGKDLNKIAKLRGVRRIYPFMELDIPMQAEIPMPFSFGRNMRYRTDLVAIGAPYSLLKGELKKYKKQWLHWKHGDEVPIMLPRKLVSDVVDLMLRSNKLPSINPSLFLGYRGKLLFGKSSFKTLPGYEVVPGRLVAYSKKVEDTAMIVPLSTVRYYNEKFLGKEAADHYQKCYVEVRGQEDLVRVARLIRKQGFIVKVGTAESRRLIQMKNAVNRFVTLIGLIVFILALIAIGFSSLIATLQRVEYFRVMRLLGASRLFLTLSVLFKAALLGFFGAITGLFVLNRLPGFASALIGSVGEWLSTPGFRVNPFLDSENASLLLKVSTLIPMIAALPALFILYFKQLNRE